MWFLSLSIVELGCLRDSDVGGFSWNTLPASRGRRLDRSYIVHCSAQGDVRQPGRHNTLRESSQACVSPVALRPRLSPSLPLSRAFPPSVGAIVPSNCVRLFDARRWLGVTRYRCL